MEAIKETVGIAQYLTFQISGEEYAVDILRVREIIEYIAPTEVPATPDPIRGVISLRGTIVPVIDLAVKFGLQETPVSRWTCIVILDVEVDGQELLMGLMVDAVNHVIELAPQDIVKPPAFGFGARVTYLLGMGRTGERLTLILDIDKVLSTEELWAAREAVTASEDETGIPEAETPEAETPEAAADCGEDRTDPEVPGVDHAPKDPPQA